MAEREIWNVRSNRVKMSVHKVSDSGFFQSVFVGTSGLWVHLLIKSLVFVYKNSKALIPFYSKHEDSVHAKLDSAAP